MITENRQPRSDSSAVPVDGLGCALDRLKLSQEVDAGALHFHRKFARQDFLSEVATPAADRGFLLGVSLSGGHRRRLLRGASATTYDFAEHAIYIRDFTDPYRAELSGAFDFVLVEFSHAWLEQLGPDISRRRINGLRNRMASRDDTLGYLMRAMLPAFAAPDPSQALFLEQVGLAVGSHLIAQYGGVPAGASVRQAVLSSWQEARAKERLSSGVGLDGSIDAIAAECQLSPSYFIRAFRGSTGQTPYQWQLAHRIERAQHLLAEGRMALVEVANACGFADQAHFTRVFSKIVGVSPGQWRRRYGAMPESCR
jgi:AraC-like DNA-binding protein